jgi:hypothetical protein
VAPSSSRHRLADAAHADDPQPLAGDSPAQHPGRRPAGEPAFADDVGAFDDPPQHGHHQRHGQVGGVLGQHPWGVGDDDPLRVGRHHVDVVDAGPEVGDQLQLRPGGGQQLAVETVGDGGGQDVGALQRLRQLVAAHGGVAEIKLGVEQLAHARLHRIGELARDDDFRLAGGHEIRKGGFLGRGCRRDFARF